MTNKSYALAIGKRIKKLRQELEMTQVEFAEKLGVDRRYISFWETGKNAISLNNLVKIHLVYHVNLGFFNVEKRDNWFCLTL
jgi:transcriptional regulator with XRE-family HTH domain